MHENVLVVEDNALDRKIICGLLEKKSFIPIESQDAFEALEKIDEEKIDLILLDIKLPKCNGFELLKRLGNYSHRNNVPIIMMSANRLDKTGIVQSFKFGASDFLVKPIQAEALYEKIEKLRLAQKINQRIKVKLPGNNNAEASTAIEILNLEQHGLTIETKIPFLKNETITLISPFFNEYGIEALKVVAKNCEEIRDVFHQFMSFEKVRGKDLEKMETIYSTLLEETQKSKQENFRGEK